MEIKKIPPHVVIESSKEIIFYIPKRSLKKIEIDYWINKLELKNYKGMIISSKCMFNRLKDKDCI